MLYRRLKLLPHYYNALICLLLCQRLAIIMNAMARLWYSMLIESIIYAIRQPRYILESAEKW